ncbi:MAG: nucleotide exchange factor GrpE [Fibrobacter sp.]|nr:nucleotide exchange factor GrpE [Fibrobacter sp.]
MAEELDPERAKFEEDVLKAAEAAMKMEKEASADANAKDGDQAASTEEKPVDDAAKSSENATEDSKADQATEQPTESAENVLKAELAAANDRYMRLMAEFDNFRRRSAKEQLDLIEVANGKLLEKFADVWENFDRAFAAENKGDLPSFEKGMQMIQTQFVKVLTDAGLEQIDPTGAEFDPNCHEALMQQPSETVPEGHVVTVFQKGYKLKNKILKTAKVIVSSGK